MSCRSPQDKPPVDLEYPCWSPDPFLLTDDSVLSLECGWLGAAVGVDRGAGVAMNLLPAQEPSSPDRARPLLLIVAYEAESHLPELIGRLAQVEGMKERWFILLLDDSSRDDTSVRAKALFAQYG